MADKPFIVEYFYNKNMQKVIDEEIKTGVYDIAIGYIIRSFPYLKKHKTNVLFGENANGFEIAKNIINYKNNIK